MARGEPFQHSSWMASSWLLLRKSFPQPLHDVQEWRAWREDLLHPTLLERRDVVVGDDAAAEDDDVGRLATLELVDDGREQRHVRARVDRKPDDLRVLLQSRVDHHLGRLPQACVDHLVACVAQRASDDLHAAIVAVEPHLGDDDPDGLGCCSHQTTAVSVYVPKTSIIACMISPSVAYSRTASRMKGIRLSVPAAALRRRLRALVHFAWSRLRLTLRTRSLCSDSRRGSMRRISMGASSSTTKSLTPTTTRRFCSSSFW